MFNNLLKSGQSYRKKSFSGNGHEGISKFDHKNESEKTYSDDENSKSSENKEKPVKIIKSETNIESVGSSSVDVLRTNSQKIEKTEPG